MKAFLLSSLGPRLVENGRFAATPVYEKNHLREYLLKSWKEKASCLFIAADPARFAMNDEIAGRIFLQLEKSGLSVGHMEICDDRNALYPLDKIGSYDVLILSGGHVPRQNRFFREISLPKKIALFDGIVIGISAGAMNAARQVYAYPELDGETRDPAYRRFFPGLGLTGINLLPHYQMTYDMELDGQRLYEDIICPDSQGRVFYAIPDGSYLYVENETELLCGEAWEIRDGKCRKISSDGECVRLKRKNYLTDTK